MKHFLSNYYHSDKEKEIFKIQVDPERRVTYKYVQCSRYKAGASIKENLPTCALTPMDIFARSVNAMKMVVSFFLKIVCFSLDNFFKFFLLSQVII